MQQRCVQCRRRFGEGFHTICDRCGGLVDVEYDLSNARLRDSADPYVRFADLLPIDAYDSAAARHGEYTPTIHALRLGKELGLRWLYLKNETVLPTGTTKDRMAVVALRYLHERGVRSFCTSSTGNSSSAYARAIRAHPGMHLVLFTPEAFLGRVHFTDHEQVTHFGLQGATFVEASEFAARFGRRRGFCVERGFFNPGRREGLKLAFLEASEQVPRPIVDGDGRSPVRRSSSNLFSITIYQGRVKRTRAGPRPPHRAAPGCVRTPLRGRRPRRPP